MHGLELLPKDVLLIVHRMVLDSNYAMLKIQYRDIWLNSEYSGGIWWCEQCFCDKHKFGIANWRRLLLGNAGNQKIYYFYGLNPVVATLPDNY